MTSSGSSPTGTTTYSCRAYRRAVAVRRAEDRRRIGRQTRLHEAESQFERMTDVWGHPRGLESGQEPSPSTAPRRSRCRSGIGSSIMMGRTVAPTGVRLNVPNASTSTIVIERPTAPYSVMSICRFAFVRYSRWWYHSGSCGDIVLDDEPIITWGLAWEPGDSTALLTHEAGDSVDADLFTVYLQDVSAGANDGTDGPREPEPADAQFSDSYGRIGPGNSRQWTLAVKRGGRYSSAESPPAGTTSGPNSYTSRPACSTSDEW